MEGPIRANLHEWGLFNFQELLTMSCNRAKQRTVALQISGGQIRFF
jgi:hypothetical protein